MTESRVPAPSGESGLEKLIDEIEAEIGEAETVEFARLVRALGARGHGPLLILLALVMILPVGMLPGMPGVVGLLLAAIGLEVMRGRRGLLLPPRLGRVALPGRRLRAALDRAEIVARWLKPWIFRRLTPLAEGRLALWAVALVLLVSGTGMIVVGFVPGLPFLMVLPVLAFGLGLTMRDGLMVAIGFAMCGAPLAAAFRLL